MKQSEKALLAACGGYCGGCPDYLAYINNDEKLKKKLAEDFSKDFNLDLKPEDIACLGCHGSIRKPWSANCPVQRCTEEKGILTCAFCHEFPCEKVGRLYEKNKEGEFLRNNILRQKEIGLEEWLAEMKEKGKILHKAYREYTAKYISEDN